MSATVPGTAAGAVRDTLGEKALETIDFDEDDWWFVGVADYPIQGPGVLELGGIATFFDVWIDGVHVASGDSMFVSTTVQFEDLAVVAIRCSSLRAVLATRRPRGRWRSTLVAQQGLRWIRTTLLGRADLFGSLPAPVGPWRAVRINPEPEPVVRTRLEGTTGVLSVEAQLPQSAVGEMLTIEVGEVSVNVPVTAPRFRTEVRLESVRTWWPHTHGDPYLHHVRIKYSRGQFDCGMVGFRDVDVDLAGGAFSLSVNGVRIFCRGACWVPLDPVSLNCSREDIRAALEQVCRAGMNMVRITGTMIYEGDDFWDLCARLGIMVWQDVMLATFDPPDTDDFSAALRLELETLLRPLASNPALVVVSGGSETEQQPAMQGLAPDAYRMDVLQEVIPRAVLAETPNVVHVSSSPSGPAGTAPFDVGTGVAHYFGVGGYLHPIDRVRSAGVRFAAECAAFAIPPERADVDRVFGSAAKAGHHPEWKARVPRDRGSSWDFEDVRDYYVREIFGVDPFEVRRTDPDRYLDLGRAAVCEALAALFAFWRRADSRCDGALVLTMRDLESGPGWGLVDAEGTPKAPWHVFRRLCAPRAVVMSSDGLDGLRVDIFNDLAVSLDAVLRLRTHDVNGNVTDSVEHVVQLDPWGSWSRPASMLWRTFTDNSYAYRFGPQSMEGTVAELLSSDGSVMSTSTFAVDNGSLQQQRDIGLAAVAGSDEHGRFIDVSTTTLARYLVVEVDGFEPSDSWFHLLSGDTRRIRLLPHGTAPARVRGRIRALNCDREASVSWD